MGESVISGGSWKEQSEINKNEDEALMGAGGLASTASTTSPSVVIWERFLPKMVVRVLLVEADDSTRQIIAALLRKCSYRVAAVSNGLKAWEILRQRPCNIDLILTEVDLPLISGYALLTLVMEHEVCKNIPVIMMSSHDSVTTVYKCMLRGATDFLVKPVRKNELSNLWQHVWRKQALSNAAGLVPLDESTCQKKEEATAENNYASDNSSSRCMTCARQSRECTAQSSCTKPDSGNDVDEVVQLDLLEPKSSKCISVEAIDLMKSFAGESPDSNICSKKFDNIHDLDLSLQRPSLNHSEASPFSRYINKPASSVLIPNQMKDNKTVVESRESNYCTPMNDPKMTSRKHIYVAAVQSANRETPYSYSPNREMHPVPGSVNEYLAKAQKEQCLPMELFHQGNCGSIDLSMKSDSLRTANPVSLGNNQNANGSFCNADTVIITPCNENVQDELLHRSMQREAALKKFLLKRKDRCFDKKVRYESRKKLAEQRPRVKGQFVRRTPNDPQPRNSSSDPFNIEKGKGSVGVVSFGRSYNMED